MSENLSFMPDPTNENTSNEIPFEAHSNTSSRENTSSRGKSGLNNLSHQMDLIRAAMPYANASRQQSMNIILKASELMHSVRNPEPELSACSFEDSGAGYDMEGLLSSLKTVGYQRENDIINMLLNTIRARRFYQTYQTVAETMPNESALSAASLGGNNGRNNFMGNSNMNHNNQNASNNNRMNSILSNPAMKEMLDSFMTPEQRSTFNNLAGMINTMSAMNSAPQTNGTNFNNVPNNNMNNGMNNNMNTMMNMMNAMNSMNNMNTMNPANPTNTANANTNPSSMNSPNTNNHNNRNRNGGNYRNSTNNSNPNHLHVMSINEDSPDSQSAPLPEDKGFDLI